jgi:hypothetical protein
VDCADNLRGRRPGEVPELLRCVLEAEGTAAELILVCPRKPVAVAQALALAAAGDLLVITSGRGIEEVLRLLDEHARRLYKGSPPGAGPT